MAKKYEKILYLLILFTWFSCDFEQDTNPNTEGEDVLETKEVYIDAKELSWQDTVYVPIYSHIYSRSKEVEFFLTATLSIRNTSLTDSIYVENINYYDTNGKLIRKYLDKILLLHPMQSIEYVIEEEDKAGGAGANFMVYWGADTSQLKPVFQGVMISVNGQQGVAFRTDGISTSRRE